MKLQAAVLILLSYDFAHSNVREIFLAHVPATATDDEDVCPIRISNESYKHKWGQEEEKYSATGSGTPYRDWVRQNLIKNLRCTY